MKTVTTIGLALFGGGIILLIIYGIIQGFEELTQAMDLITMTLSGIIIIGFLVLLGTIVIEQRKDTKKTMEHIKKEDLKP
jgi:uncharacterized membrane protein YesL